MQIEQTRWTDGGEWKPAPTDRLRDADLVMLFGAGAVMKDPELLRTIKGAYPRASLLGCSTAGEIYGEQVHDDSLVVTAIDFESTRFQGSLVRIRDCASSYDAGVRLAQSLDKEGLVHLFVLSDGLAVNGSDLVAGLSANLPDHVTVTGGLSGDGARFKETLVLWNGAPETDAVVAVGLYGDRLKVGYGSLGGWDPFGPERLITRSKGNVLYELDGTSALELYKTYLGEQAKGLPATGLLFPLNLRAQETDVPVVRTILAVSEEEGSMTFAGDLPEGAHARFMKANFDRLVDGAIGAARVTYEAIGSSSPDLAVLISCVGRKLILKQRIEEEVEGVREVLGARTVMAGFYSYGEISPFTPGAKCELHNQTMTITTFSET